MDQNHSTETNDSSADPIQPQIVHSEEVLDIPASGSNNSRSISVGDNLLLKLPSGQIKPIRNLTPNTSISLGKFGKFQVDELINQPYGLTYEILEDGRLSNSSIPSCSTTPTSLTLVESLSMVANGICNVEDIEATNENIKESDGAQKMTADEIEQLKKSGLSGREIILRQIQQHSAFELKSEYSKAKYIKRKEKKFLKMFTCLDPTIHNVTQFLFENNHLSIKGLRPDSLSQMLSLSNVRPGWKGIVVDEIGGLLVGAVLTRMGGQGTLYVINNADSPPDLHLLAHLNLPSSSVAPLRALNWAQIEPGWSTADIDELLAQPARGDEGGSSQTEERTKDKERSKQRKRQLRVHELQQVRQDFLDTEFEGLIACSDYDPESVLGRLSGRLGGSSSVVVYSPYLVPLSNLQNGLRKSLEFIHVTISEPWLRRYQVLPGRTHPEMNGTQGGGFILSAIKVIGV